MYQKNVKSSHTRSSGEASRNGVRLLAWKNSTKTLVSGELSKSKSPQPLPNRDNKRRAQKPILNC